MVGVIAWVRKGVCNLISRPSHEESWNETSECVSGAALIATALYFAGAAEGGHPSSLNSLHAGCMISCIYE